MTNQWNRRAQRRPPGVQKWVPEKMTICFFLNLHSYGKSPFLKMVNQRWLAGKSLEVNMEVIAVKIIYIHGPWLPSRTVELPEGTFYIETGGWHPKWKNFVFRVRAPLQGEVAGVINFGTLVTSRFFIIWHMPSGHTHMILLPPSLHGRSGFPR